MMKMFKFGCVLALCFVVFNATQAFSYIGPGLGVVAAWALFGPIGAIVMTIVIIGFFPARYYYKKYKFNKEQAKKQAGAGDGNTPDDVEVQAVSEEKAIENKE